VAPRTAAEAVLAEIWQEVLGVERVGISDSFFDLGGHSLLAVLLMARIEKRCGRSLPLAALFAAPTVEALAALLDRAGAQPGRSPLVAIRPAGRLAPFFCVHPVGGQVLCYLDLVRHLAPDLPFYALQSPPDLVPQPAAPPPGPASIEGMAARYLSEVRRVQPRGPYRLGGWSLGGVIAFEMARQLAAEGERVSFLALIDSLPPAPEPGRPATEQELGTWFAGDLLALLGRGAPVAGLAALDRQLAVNLFGPYAVTQAFLPALTRSRGAIVNNLSLNAFAPLPVIPAYSVSKAAAFSLTQSLRALLAGRGVRVHAVLTGPTDTDMTRGYDIPKVSAQSVAQAIFDGVELEEEDIFPDPLSASVADSWRNGATKALERQLAASAAA